MKHDIRTLFGITLPIIQAPMAGVQNHALVTAVCNAGGLGSLPCAMLTPSQIADELRVITAATLQPYNLNFFCHTPPTPDAAREAQWRHALQPYYTEFGIDASAIIAGAGRLPFSDAIADVIAPFAPPIVSFHFGLPAPSLLARVRGWGAKVISSATTLGEARWLAAQGVDAIIAQGVEAGGHRGMFLTDDLGAQPGTRDLLHAIVNEIDLPIIAAGGIASPEDVRAMREIGAAGVQIGTLYMLTPEATTSPPHRAALKNMRPQDTALTNLFTGRPARGITNRLMRDLGAISPLAPAFPLATSALAPLRERAQALERGDFTPLWSGLHQQAPTDSDAATITRRLGQAMLADAAD